MLTGTLIVVFLLPATLVGLAAGWWICASGTREPGRPPEEAEPPLRPDWIVAQSVIARLQQLAENMAADVGRHSSRVHEINAELRCHDGNINIIAAVEKILAANETMQAQLDAAEQRLQAQATEMNNYIQEARTDPLTKLANRRAFDEEMQRRVDALRSGAGPSCVAIIDIDHFKRVNDQYGHPAGDEILCGVARLLRRNHPERAIVCRYGGEEFAVLFPGVGIEEAKLAVERARFAIADEAFQAAGQDVRITVTSGVAQIGLDESAREVVQRADDALYVGKQKGRDRGYWHDGKTIQAVGPLPPPAQTGGPPDAADSSTSSPQHAVPDSPPRSLPQFSDPESFFSDVERLASNWVRGGAPLSVLLVEVDRCEQIRATSGAEAAQAALNAVADTLQRCVRSLDSLTRVEDDVFAVLLPGSVSERAWAVADRIQRSLSRRKLLIDGERLRFTVSIGVADVTSGCARTDLIERAFQSLAAMRLGIGNLKG